MQKVEKGLQCLYWLLVGLIAGYVYLIGKLIALIPYMIAGVITIYCGVKLALSF